MKSFFILLVVVVGSFAADCDKNGTVKDTCEPLIDGVYSKLTKCNNTAKKAEFEAYSDKKCTADKVDLNATDKCSSNKVGKVDIMIEFVKCNPAPKPGTNETADVKVSIATPTVTTTTNVTTTSATTTSTTTTQTSTTTKRAFSNKATLRFGASYDKCSQYGVVLKGFSCVYYKKMVYFKLFTGKCYEKELTVKSYSNPTCTNIISISTFQRNCSTYNAIPGIYEQYAMYTCSLASPHAFPFITALVILLFLFKM